MTFLDMITAVKKVRDELATRKVNEDPLHYKPYDYDLLDAQRLSRELMDALEYLQVEQEEREAADESEFKRNVQPEDPRVER